VKRIIVLALAVLMLNGCGVLDWDGSNAAAKARAESAATIAAENGHTERVIAIENAHTERVLAILAFFEGDNGNPLGTNHNGGITAGLQVGFGVGWPFVAVGGGLLLAACALYLRQQKRL
jgi:hypothetical protein